MIDVLTLGEALVAFRARGRLAVSAPVAASPVGAEMNVVIGLCRLGHSASWAGVLGEDPAGDLVERTLRAEGADLSFVRRTSAAPTAVMLVDTPAALPPVVTYHRRDAAGSRLTAAQVAEAWRGAPPRILHVTGITPALSSAARDAVMEVAAHAHAVGTTVSLDVNYRSKLWSRDDATTVLSELAQFADVVIASDDELDLVSTGSTEDERIAHLLSGRAQDVVVKRGADGAESFRPEGRLAVRALPVSEVNSIGAGDAFTAGYLSGMLDGLPVSDRLARAAACGAFAVSGEGDWEQAPTRADLARLSAASRDAHR